MRLRNSILAIAIVVGSVLLAPVYGPGIRARAASPSAEELDRNIRSVANAYSLIEQNFADPVSSERAFYQGAIPGMLHTLDPHSNFVDPADYREMQRRQHAQYFGVGMEITMDQGKVVVMQPFPNSPAANAGLRRGDVIASIDDKDATGLDSAAVANLLRGPRGTQVRVSVRREGAAQPVSTVVTRGEIATSLVDAFWLRPGIAYLKIESFEAQNVSRDVEAAFRKMGEESVTGLVLDLRGNPGGLVTEAVSVAGRFLKNSQLVVSHRGRAEQEQVFRAKAQAMAQKYPIVVLVDRQSASAAEIVSGALQDHDRAWLIGESTFGKGLVQAQFPLSEGAALLLTIAHYYTPSGRLIQRDYQHRSFFDYLYNRSADNQETQDIKATDSGRKVFGGGGITPDEKYATPRTNLFQRRVGAILNTPNSFYHYASQYFSGKAAELPEGWQPDDKVVDGFKEFLKGRQVQFTDEEFAANRDWLKSRIRWEFYFRAFGKKSAERARWQEDPEILKAVESLPKAHSLVQDLEKVLARRVTQP